ncbi:hypothetical protein IV102_08080 [bacterium]|nr:hypothetical protein [bacterium]
MLKFELPNVMPSPGNPFSAVTSSDSRIGGPDAFDLPTTIKTPADTPAPATEEAAPMATTMAQLVEAMQGAEILFHKAFTLALKTRDRETELLQRAEEAEREARHNEREAAEWKGRYEALDQRIPWWVRKLFRAS